MVCIALAGCSGGEGSGAANPGSSGPTLGPAELAILVAEGDTTGESIARAYQRARGVPDANVIRVRVPATGDEIAATDFATLKATIDARLPGTVQATLLTWTAPSRVVGTCTMSITSALALGFDAQWCANTCETTAPTAYFASASRRPFTDFGIRPSMMLGLGTLAEAQALIDRGVSADGMVTNGRAMGTGWLVRTNDVARSVRWPDFRTLASQPVSGVVLNYLDNSSGTGSNAVANQNNVLFYFTGLATVPQIGTNSWLPGAAADHLTSYGGHLPLGLGQMPSTDWLRAGATASYGTVAEPCNITDKFPRASTLVNRYQAGDTLLEAYWKSVRTPGQGLFVGEPLARPWAR
jgi:uncharacterized protein (TIGR03790 family)